VIPAETLQEWRRLAETVNAPPREPAGYNCLGEMDARSEILKRLAREAVPQLLGEVARPTLANIAEMLANYLDMAVLEDSDAIDRLFRSRVTCLDELADHPTIQVQEEPDGSYSLGILGLLNGWLAPGGTLLAAVCELSEDGTTVGRHVRFRTILEADCHQSEKRILHLDAEPPQ
jgi:hypothetical protein